MSNWRVWTALLVHPDAYGKRKDNSFTLLIVQEFPASFEYWKVIWGDWKCRGFYEIYRIPAMFRRKLQILVGNLQRLGERQLILMPFYVLWTKTTNIRHYVQWVSSSALYLKEPWVITSESVYSGFCWGTNHEIRLIVIVIRKSSFHRRD